MMIRILVWCFGLANCLNIATKTRRLLATPFYYAERQIRMCEDDKNGYPHALRQAQMTDWLESFGTEAD
jgi:hypothetical protein